MSCYQSKMTRPDLLIQTPLIDSVTCDLCVCVCCQVTEMDISKQLHAYEVEYHVLQDEMLDAGPLPDDCDRLDRLEKTNVQLKKQNMDLLEKLQVQ